MTRAPDPRLIVNATRDGDRVAYDVTLMNRGDAAFTRVTPTSRKVDVTARGADARVLHRYGDGLVFLQVLTEVTVAPGDQVTLAGDAFHAPAEPVTLHATLPGEGDPVTARVTI
jgi:hypothetical protein